MAKERVVWQRLLPELMKDDEGIVTLPAGPVLYRCKVEAGWVVSTGSGEGSGLTFVPDPEHKWNV